MPVRNSKSRRIATIATLLVMAILLCGGLYLARVFSQLSYLTSRNFRIAATLAEVTEARLNNVASVLENQAKPCIAWEAENHGTNKKKANPCEDHRGPRCFVHLGWHSADEGGEHAEEPTGNSEEDDHEDHPHDDGRTDASDEDGDQGRSKSGDDSDAPEGSEGQEEHPHAHAHAPSGTTTIEVDHGKSELQFLYTPPNEEREAAPGELHATVDVECFLGLIEREQVFDDIVVLDSGDWGVFQTGGSGARIHELSTAPSGVEGGKTPGDGNGQPLDLQAAVVSRLEEQEIAGERYALFRQPVRLDFKRPDSKEDALWEVVGLVRSDRLWADAMRIGPSGLVVLISLLLLALCAWPFFKLSAMGRRERIHPREVLWVSASLAVACALLAIATLDLGLNEGRRLELEDELEDAADEIEAALTGEIGDALGQLSHVLAEDGGEYWHQCGLYGDSGCPKGVHAGGLFRPTLDRNGGPFLDIAMRSFRPALDWREYPYLEMVFWTDACGNQVAKRSVGEEPTPLISVAGREYFQRARDRDLWSPADWPHVRPGDAPVPWLPFFAPVPRPPFFVQPLRSWTTGEQEVVLSVAYGEGEPDEPGCEKEEIRGSPVAAMSIIKLPSMLRPILPPGRGFAVVDGQGRVVFHSRPERNGLENLLLESENPPELRSAFFARTERHFTAGYRGRKRQMYSRPLTGLPWHVVVFENRDVVQTVNFEAAMAALLLSVVQLVLLAAAVAFIRLVGRRPSLRLLWPPSGDVGAYGRMITILLLVVFAFGASFTLAPSSGSLLRTGFLLPLTALGLIAAAAAPPRRGRKAQRRAALLVAAASALALLAWEVGDVVVTRGGARAVGLLLVHGVALAGSFAVTAHQVGIASVRRRLRRPAAGRWSNPALLFVVISGLTLAVLSALPAVSFLQAAFQERLDVEVRRAQVHLARDLLERGRELEAGYGDLPPRRPVPPFSVPPEPRQRILTDGRDVHFRSYLGTCYAYDLDGSCLAEAPLAEPVSCAYPNRQGDGEKACTAGTFRPARPKAWTLSSLPFSNRHSVEARAVLSDSRSEPRSSWTWSTPDGGRRDGLVFTARSPVDDLGVAVSSRVPAAALPLAVRSPELWLFVAAGLASLALIVPALLFLGRRMFHVDFRVGQPPALAALAEQYFTRLLVVVPPGTEIGATFGEADLTVDLAETGTPGGDPELERLQDLPAEGLVRIDHLEGALDDAPSREKAFSLFEKAVTRAGKGLRIAVFAHRDPRAVLDEGRARLEGSDDAGAARQTLKRWEALLENLSEQWISDAGDRDRFDREIGERLGGAGGEHGDGADEPRWSRRQLAVLRRECRWSRPLQEIGRHLLRQPKLAAADPDDLLRRISQEAADHYRALWRALAADERHVLAQLACGCLANRGVARSLDHLLKWGLIVREPSTFRVMNESFRRFVVSHHDAEELADWEAEGSVSVWRQARVPFFTVLAAAGLFLLVTQRQLFNLAIAVATAGAATVPGLIKLFGWVRQARKVTGAE